LIKKAKESEDFPIALLGNKCDLVDSREVSEKAGKDLSKEQQTLFFETSAKVRKNVEESVAALVKTVIQYNTVEEEEEVKPQLTKKTSFLKGLFGRKK
jgi:GTPase KRas protein